MLRDEIQKALTEAMKLKDMKTVGAVRLIIAKIKEKDVDIRGKGGKEAVDEDVIQLMQNMIKQRRDSIKMFEEGGRPELAAKEQCEIEVIEKFMPEQMSDAEIEAEIKKIIAEVGASSMKDMGKIMAGLKEKCAGKMDMGKAGGIIKGLLN